jgi:sigma-E factor negative regulatory protein RseA
LRTRLQAEPVVLAPAPAVATPRRTRRIWWAPMAAAAGFVAVAGVVVVLRQAAPDAGGSGAQMAGAGAISPLRVSSTPAAPGPLVRDPRIDAYLDAHRAALAGSPPVLPGGGLRNVDFDVPQR